MPLFNFKCKECGHEKELFYHSAKDIQEVICEICNGDCDRVFSVVQNSIYLDATDTYEQQIKPGVERTLEKMDQGDIKELMDVCGDKPKEN